MRITLSWKITAILVVFGLVPASIVAWFAYNSNDDYRKKQTLIVVKTTEAISFRAAAILEKDPKVVEQALQGSLEEKVRRAIEDVITTELGQSAIQSAQVYIVTAEGRVLVWRKPTQGFDSNVANSTMDFRYLDLAKKAAAGDHIYQFIEAGDDSGSKSELVSYAPLHLSVLERGPQRLVAMIAIPRNVVFESILKNQPPLIEPS